MGNQNSAYPKAQGGKAEKDASTEPQYAPMQKKPSTKAEKVPMQKKPSTKVEKVGHGVLCSEQHGNYKKPLYDDDTFTNYIQRAKKKFRSLSTLGRRHHEEEHRNNPAPDVATNVESSNKENEVDQFSHFIQNARKKLRTVSTVMGKNSSFKKGKDSGH